MKVLLLILDITSTKTSLSELYTSVHSQLPISDVLAHSVLFCNTLLHPKCDYKSKIDHLCVPKIKRVARGEKLLAPDSIFR